jgi:hypothetical protein
VRRDPPRAARATWQSDPPPERIGVNIPLGVPALATLTDRAITNNPVTRADDTGVLLEIDVRPLVHEIGLRERAPPIQRRFERRNEVCHRRGIRGDSRRDEDALHAPTS